MHVHTTKEFHMPILEEAIPHNMPLQQVEGLRSFTLHLGPTFRIDGFGKYGLTEVVLLIRHLLALNLQSVRSSGWSRMMLSNFHHYQQLYRNWLIKPAGSTVTSPVLTNLQTEFKYRLLKMLSLNICQHFSVYHKQFFV